MLELEHSGGIRAFVRFAGRFLANESQPARRATPMPSARNARTRRSHVVAAARISQRCIRTALPRRVGRIPAGFRRPSNGNTKGHESSIRRSRTLPPLYGSSQLLGGRTHMYHARIARQVRATLAPLAAKGRPMRTSKWRFAVAHGRQQPRSLAERQHPSRSSSARVEPSGFAAERRPHPCRIPTAVQWQHEASRIVNPMIPDLAAAARRLAAAEQMRPHKYRSDRTPGPVCACAARREGPSHADTEMALRCRPRTPATPQLGGEAAPIQIIA